MHGFGLMKLLVNFHLKVIHLKSAFQVIFNFTSLNILLKYLLQGALTHGDRRATESTDLSRYNFDTKVNNFHLEVSITMFFFVLSKSFWIRSDVVACICNLAT